MNKLILPLIAAALLAGCSAYEPTTAAPGSTTSVGSAPAPAAPSPVILALENPNSIGKAAQLTVQLGATAFLGKNTKYKDDLVAVADGLLVLAASNPSAITQGDIGAALSGTKLSQADQTEFASYAISALGLFETSFNVDFPQLKPSYAIYLKAVANGIYGATGNTSLQVPLPIIPWPPAPAPTPTPTPTPAPLPAPAVAPEDTEATP